MFRDIPRNLWRYGRHVTTSLSLPLQPLHMDVARISKHAALSNFMAGRASDPLPSDIENMVEGIFRGERRALSKGITLVESLNPGHRLKGNQLLVGVLHELSRRQHNHRRPHGIASKPLKVECDNPYLAEISSLITVNGGKPTGPLRIGISGTPGVGKSTFIESFGMHLINKYGLKVAVLSIDPSSLITGGSILGDKTRMQLLSNDDNAYIRPSPSKCTLGGVAQDTGEAALLCEAAGYDIILIETVGVGQSEVTVAQITDMVVLLMNPGGGDELQGIKKGIMEMADLVVVTKADGDLLSSARRTMGEYQRALHVFMTMAQNYGWQPRAMMCSVKKDTEHYMDAVWGQILEFEQTMLHNASEITHARGVAHTQYISGWSSAESTRATEAMSMLEAKRAVQRRQWMWSQLSEELMVRMKRFSKTQELDSIELQLVHNLLTPRIAAEKVFDAFLEGQLKALEASRQAAAETKS